MIQRILFRKWSDEIDPFPTVQKDIDFCKSAIRFLSTRKRITKDERI